MASLFWLRAAGEPGLRYRASELCDEQQLANQTLAQLDLWAKKDSYKIGVYVLPKKLDEEVRGCTWRRSASS